MYRATLALALATAAAPAARAADPPRWNLLLVTADDLPKEVLPATAGH